MVSLHGNKTLTKTPSHQQQSWAGPQFLYSFAREKASLARIKKGETIDCEHMARSTHIWGKGCSQKLRDYFTLSVWFFFFTNPGTCLRHTLPPPGLLQPECIPFLYPPVPVSSPPHFFELPFPQGVVRLQVELMLLSSRHLSQDSVITQ